MVVFCLVLHTHFICKNLNSLYTNLCLLKYTEVRPSKSLTEKKSWQKKIISYSNLRFKKIILKYPVKYKHFYKSSIKNVKKRG